MDSLVYRYQTNCNRLTHVDDPGGVAGNHSFDVDDQDTNTYTYDASGNMIGDTASGITAIVWTPSNDSRHDPHDTHKTHKPRLATRPCMSTPYGN